MFQGEVSGWITSPATASPSASRSARRNASDWPSPGWITDSIPWPRPVRATSMVTAKGSTPWTRRDATSDCKIISSPRLSDLNQPTRGLRRLTASPHPPRTEPTFTCPNPGSLPTHRTPGVRRYTRTSRGGCSSVG